MPTPTLNGSTTSHENQCSLERRGAHTPKKKNISTPKPSISNTSLCFRDALIHLERCHLHELQHLRRCSEQMSDLWQERASASFKMDALGTCQGYSSYDSSLPEVLKQEPSINGPEHTLPQLDIPWLTDDVAKKWSDLSRAVFGLESKCRMNIFWNRCPATSQRARESSAITGSDSGSCSTSLVGGLKLFRAVSSFSESEASHNRCCKPIHPTSKKRLSWDILGATLCVYELIILPLLFASLIETTISVSIFVCMFWTLDLGMSCITGYFIKDGNVESRMKFILTNYLKTWFGIDITLVTIDWAILLFGEGAAYGKVMKSILRVVRVVRVVRILRLAPRLQEQLGRLTSQYMFTFLRVLGYLMMVILINHYVACTWCATWSEVRSDEQLDASKVYKYFTGLHWSFAHCVLGSMDIRPLNAWERAFTCSILLTSLALFSTILSMITNDALTLRSLAAERNTKTATLMSFFSEHRFPSHLRCRVWYFVQQHQLFDGKSELHDSAYRALQLLPVHVQQEIRHAWFAPVLRNHPFFCYYEQLEPSAMWLLCKTGISVVTLLTEEELVWHARKVEQMVFVEKGKLEYHEEDQRTADPIVIGPGMWACEEALWGTSVQLAGKMIVGMDMCSLLLISCKEFREIAFSFGDSFGSVRHYAKVFVDNFNRTCNEGFRQEDVLFNSPEQVEEVMREAFETMDLSNYLLPLVTEKCCDDGYGSKFSLRSTPSC